MKRLAVLAVALLLSACVTSGQTDSGGTNMLLTERGQFEPWESRFNTFLLLNPEAEYETKATERDNGNSWWEDIDRADGPGRIHVEHQVMTWFSATTEQSMEDRTLFDTLAAALPHDMSKAVPFDISNRRVRGWSVLTNDCVTAVFSKRLKPPTMYDNDRGLPDTVVMMSGCGFLDVTPEEFAQGLALIEPSDKAAMQVRIQKTN